MTEKTNNTSTLNTIITFFKERPWAQYILFGVLLSTIAILPQIGVMRSSTMSVFALIIIYTVAAFGLNLLLGFSALISLATAGFIGGGALGMGIFLNMGLPFEVAVLLVILSGIVIGAFIGVLSLKSQGIYLAITTLFVQEILRQIYTSVGIFGGERIDIGTITILGGIDLNRFIFTQRSIIFVILIVVMVLIMIIFRNLIKSRSGRAFMAMSRSKSAAAAMGVNIMKYRVYAFIIATVFAMLAGVLYAMYYQSAPTRAWTLDLSLLLLAIVVAGGFKSVFGMFLGAFVVYGIPSLLLEDIFGDVSEIFAGLLIILVVLFYPQGLIHSGPDIKKGFKKLIGLFRKKEVTQDE